MRISRRTLTLRWMMGLIIMAALQRVTLAMRPDRGDRHPARHVFSGEGGSNRAGSQSPLSSLVRDPSVNRCRLGAVDQVSVWSRVEGYRRKAESCEKMIRRCRKIDAMDELTRKRADDDEWDDPFLHDPAWNREMITYFEKMKQRYLAAAEYPRLPLPPAPVQP